MRRLIAVALVVAGVAIPVCAQRGGGGRGGAAGHSGGFTSRGGSIGSGFAGHSSQAFHTNFAPAIHSNVVGSTQFRGGQYGAGYRRPGVPVGVRPTKSGIGHRPRPPYVYERSYVPYGTGLAYVGSIDPDCFSFGDCDPYDGAYSYGPAVAPDVNPDAYAQGSPPYANQGGEADEMQADATQLAPFRPAYQRPSPPPEPQPPVTLVFKDGRPPEQIHNYMLTRTTLYVQDEHHREIAVSDLDLAATEKANKDAGVAFQLPGVSPSGL